MSRFMIMLGMFLLAACGGKDQLPEGVLGETRMRAVMKDVLLAESYAESLAMTDTVNTRDQIISKELSKVMAVHKISQNDFRRSLDFYKQRPDLFKVIIDSIQSEAKRNQERVFNAQ